VGIIERPGHQIVRFRTDLVDYQWYLEKVRAVYPKPDFENDLKPASRNIFEKRYDLRPQGNS
jgi:hypothetical protein